MQKTLSIGKHKVTMLANGATPLYYKNVFHKDLISRIHGSEDHISEVSDDAPELAFIMAMQAKAAKEGNRAMLLSLDFDKFVDWLEGFEAASLIFKADEIMELYFADSEPSASSKKKAEEAQE